MTAPVLYDLTYVAARLGAAAPTGIERVDLALAHHCVDRAGDGPGACALHYGLFAPHRLAAASARRLLAEASAVWEPPAAADPAFAALMRWLQAPPAPFAPVPPSRRPAPQRALRRLHWRLAHDPSASIGRDAIYLNCAQYAFEFPWFFRWLDHRPDVRPVLFVHDLLPLDHPEFFPAGYEARFARRIATVARYAHALIVSTEVVRERLEREMARRGRPGLPCLTLPLPPPAMPGRAVVPASAAPYFVAIGTVETRKNHLLLLHAWRQLAERGAELPRQLPRLVIVGARGWESEQAQDLLDRCRAISPHVAEVSGLSSAAVAALIAGARALLMPSFAEGYGLPVAEALAAGTPVIASDLPVFTEVSQGSATLLDPGDGPGWRDAVMAFAPHDSPSRERARQRAGHYAAPTWTGAAGLLDDFLANLQKSEARPRTSQSP